MSLMMLNSQSRIRRGKSDISLSVHSWNESIVLSEAAPRDREDKSQSLDSRASRDRLRSTRSERGGTAVPGTAPSCPDTDNAGGTPHSPTTRSRCGECTPAESRAVRSGSATRRRATSRQNLPARVRLVGTLLDTVADGVPVLVDFTHAAGAAVHFQTRIWPTHFYRLF